MYNYYAHYKADTGEIYSVSNEKHPEHEYSVLLSYEEHDAFTSNRWHMQDYVISYGKNADDETVLMPVLKADNANNFKNARINWISERNQDTDVTVHWKPDGWTIDISQPIREGFNEQLLKWLFFAVVNEKNPDQLIRTIVIDTVDIKKSAVDVPFVSDWERDITRILVGTRTEFKSYRLIK